MHRWPWYVRVLICTGKSICAHKQARLLRLICKLIVSNCKRAVYSSAFKIGANHIHSQWTGITFINSWWFERSYIVLLWMFTYLRWIVSSGLSDISILCVDWHWLQAIMTRMYNILWLTANLSEKHQKHRGVLQI